MDPSGKPFTPTCSQLITAARQRQLEEEETRRQLEEDERKRRLEKDSSRIHEWLQEWIEIERRLNQIVEEYPELAWLREGSWSLVKAENQRNQLLVEQSIRRLEERKAQQLEKGRAKQRKKPFMEINLDGKKYDALADTMASENIMTEAHATMIGAVVNRSKRRNFRNACGQTFKSVGETKVEVSLPEDPSKNWVCSFAVLKSCPIPLVVSDSFLRVTETLTKFQHRLKRIFNTTQKYWRVMYMDIPRRQLACSIDGISGFANADTGSEIDIVSLKYAQTRGWDIKKLKSDEGYVQLSDGSIVKLAGYVKTRLDVGTTSSLQTFYVLEGLECDVLLGDGTLQELDVFKQHESLFEDLQQSKVGIFHFIKWLQKMEDHARQIIENDFPSGFWEEAPSEHPLRIPRLY